MKNLKAFLLLGITFIQLISCSSSDPVTPEITTSNLTVNVDENQDQDAVLGKITANSNTGTVSFSIVSQIPQGALKIDATTGEVKVADPSLFDFETYTQITAKVKVTDQTISIDTDITITLNDVDDIAKLLTTSKANYDAADNGAWVAVTEAEYENLKTKLPETSTSGIKNEHFYDSEGFPLDNKTNYLLFNTKADNFAYTIPANSYVFAFKYIATDKAYGTLKVLTAKAQDQDATQIGYNISNQPSSPEPIEAPYDRNLITKYYVLKGATLKTAQEAFLGIHNHDVDLPLYSNLYAQGYYYVRNNFTGLPDSTTKFTHSIYSPRHFYTYQGLSTTKMQW